MDILSKFQRSRTYGYDRVTSGHPKLEAALYVEWFDPNIQRRQLSISFLQEKNKTKFRAELANR